jgi:penicillin-binding protein 1A
MRLVRLVFVAIVAPLLVISVLAAAIALTLIKEQADKLPSLDGVGTYRPLIASEIRAADGAMLARLATENRLLVDVKDMPPLIANAFIAAEDQNFWRHPGVDLGAVIRAAATNLKRTDKRPVGGSTITQQVVKNMVLANNERTMDRKIKEALLALRLEQKLDKAHILNLYLNDIYLGAGSYGVAAAADTYFGKKLADLSVGEAAYLAGLPKAPSAYALDHDHDAAVQRRNYVLKRMLDEGYISADQYQQALSEALPDAPVKRGGEQITNHYLSETRRIMSAQFGADNLFGQGYTIQVAMDAQMQSLAEQALRRGLVAYDRRNGSWRGAVAHLPTLDRWQQSVDDQDIEAPVPEWEIGVISDLRKGVSVTLRDGANLPLAKADADWATSKRTDMPLAVGDVVFVERDGRELALRQVPKVDGGLVMLDPATGRVLAMSGGFSFAKSEFNRATQALRQPGSSLKSFIYLSALKEGWTPNTPIPDVEIAMAGPSEGEFWRPHDHGFTSSGLITLRQALAISRNTATLRLFQEIDRSAFSALMSRLGVYDNLQVDNPAVALGAQETTLLRLASAYASIPNHGQPVRPVIVAKVTDRDGNVVLDATAPRAAEEPIADPVALAQITSMLEGVVRHGTAARAFSGAKYAVAGKTGTSNDSHDAWFIGFTPNLVVGAYIGYDQPDSLGKETGGSLVAPVVRSVFDQVDARYRSLSFDAPPKDLVEVIHVDPETGLPVEKGGITEIVRKEQKQ